VTDRQTVVLAPDKFRGSLTAAEVCLHLRRGLRQSGRPIDVISIPVADGGEGTVAAAEAAGFEIRVAEVSGPIGRPVVAKYAVRADTAIVEMAQASGLGLLPTAGQPLLAGTFGTGELIRLALDTGARRVILGVGGSASTDGGAGVLQALGVRLLDAYGREIGPGGAALRELQVIDLAGLDPRLRDVELVLASDVDNPLLGPEGAAAVFGPQKGASPSDIEVLEAGLSRLASVVKGLTMDDRSASAGSGAAGGLGFSAIALLGARQEPGGDLMLELVDFHSLVEQADLVVTGEGSLDAQSLHGKVPARVAAAAAAAGVPAVAVAGQVLLDRAELSRMGFVRSYALVDREPDISRSMAGAAGLLEAVGRELAASIDLISRSAQRSHREDREPMSNSCPLCQGNETPVEELPPRERVHIGSSWRVIAHRSALPGWLLVTPRRHVESLHELSPAEWQEMGTTLGTASSVLVDTLGCVKTYAMLFAEGMSHVHFSLVPRMADIPADRKGAAVSAYNSKDEPQSEAERDRVAALLARAWPTDNEYGKASA